jgi:hypothetical protein
MKAGYRIPIRSARFKDEWPPMVGTTTDEVEHPGKAMPERVGTYWQEVQVVATQQLVLAAVMSPAERDDERSVQVRRSWHSTARDVVPSDGWPATEMTPGQGHDRSPLCAKDRSAKRARVGRKANRTAPIGPERFFLMRISAVPASAEAGW